jgi:hypothetical protein
MLQETLRTLNNPCLEKLHFSDFVIPFASNSNNLNILLHFHRLTYSLPDCLYGKHQAMLFFQILYNILGTVSFNKANSYRKNDSFSLGILEDVR